MKTAPAFFDMRLHYIDQKLIIRLRTKVILPRNLQCPKYTE